MSTISSGTTSTTTLIHSGDTTGSLVFKTNDTGSGGTTAMTIDTSQNVGIGITSPTRKLQVKGGTIGVTSADGTVTNVMDYSSIGTSTNSAFTLVTNGADRLTVDTSGNVGIGTSSPSAKLQVSNSGDVVVLSKSTGSGGGGIFRGDGDGAGSFPGFQLAQSGTTYWTAGQRGDTNLHFYRETGSGRVIVDFGSLQVATTVGVGAATPSTSGAGITFPATQSSSSDANTLDDYEEGTWTPSLSGSSGTATYGGVRAGRYTKIGNFVYVNCTIASVGKNTLSGSLAVTGLPFTAADSNSNALLRYDWGATVSFTMVIPQMAAGSTQYNIQLFNNSGYAGDITAASCGATINIYALTACYSI